MYLTLKQTLVCFLALRSLWSTLPSMPVPRTRLTYVRSIHMAVLNLHWSYNCSAGCLQSGWSLAAPVGFGAPLAAGEDEIVKYYWMLIGVSWYVCRPNADNAHELSHHSLDKQIVIDAGARALVEEAQAVLLETRKDGWFVYKEQMRMVWSPRVSRILVELTSML